MENLNQQQLIKVRGGATLSSQMLNAISKTASTLFSIGQALGSAIRRIYSKKVC